MREPRIPVRHIKRDPAQLAFESFSTYNVAEYAMMDCFLQMDAMINLQFEEMWNRFELQDLERLERAQLTLM